MKNKQTFSLARKVVGLAALASVGTLTVALNADAADTFMRYNTIVYRTGQQ